MNVGSFVVSLSLVAFVWSGLSIVALTMVGGVTCTLGVSVVSCTCTLGVGVAICTLGVGISICILVVGCVSLGGFDMGSKVTRLAIVVCVLLCGCHGWDPIQQFI